MVDYNGYIDKLKRNCPDVNYGKMCAAIEERIDKPSLLIFTRVSLASAVVTIMLMISFFYYSSVISRNNSILNYVMDGDAADGSPVISYVFNEEMEPF